MPALAIADALESARPTSSRCWSAPARGGGAAAAHARFPLSPAPGPSRSIAATWWKNVRWPLIAGRLLRAVSAGVRGGAAGGRAGDGRICVGPGRLVGGAHGVPDRDPGAERLSRAGDPTAEPARAARLSRAAGGEIAAALRARRPRCSTPATRSRRRRRTRRAEALGRFGLDGSRPVVLVTGGSQGALAINRAVAGWLDAGGPARRRSDLGHRPRDLRGVRAAPPAAGGAGDRLPRSDGGRLRGRRPRGLAGRA